MGTVLISLSIRGAWLHIRNRTLSTVFLFFVEIIKNLPTAVTLIERHHAHMVILSERSESKDLSYI